MNSYVHCRAVIVTYNSAEVIEHALKNLTGISADVVDNASTDGTADLVARSFPAVTVRRNRTNRGFAAAVNQIAELLDPDEWLLVLNPDVCVPEDAVAAISEIIDAANQEEGVGVVAPILVSPNGDPQPFARRFPTLGRQLGRLVGRPISVSVTKKDGAPLLDVDWIIGAAMLIPPWTLSRVGMFDERFFLYAEDVDYCLRVQQAGLRVVVYRNHAWKHRYARAGRQLYRFWRPEARLHLVSLWRLYRKHPGKLLWP